MIKQEKSRHTPKQERFGNFFTFRNRPGNKPEEGSSLLKRTKKRRFLKLNKEPRKEPVKVLDCDSV